MALNLALYLAKKKNSTGKLNQLEPEFIKLVNGTVKVVAEITQVINAARTTQKTTYEIPNDNQEYDHLEVKLNSILKQCQEIMDCLVVEDEIEL